MGGDTSVLLVGGHPVILGVVRLAVASREALDVVGEVGTATAEPLAAKVSPMARPAGAACTE